MKKAIVFGASGFIGSYLINNLLHSDSYSEVLVVVRKPLNLTHPKLKTIVADYQSLALHQDELFADDVFIALGTTKKKTPNESEYYQIDHDYPVLA
ncbi:SDR family oxidoreductase, partial [Pedobacter sp.]